MRAVRRTSTATFYNADEGVLRAAAASQLPSALSPLDSQLAWNDQRSFACSWMTRNAKTMTDNFTKSSQHGLKNSSMVSRSPAARSATRSKQRLEPSMPLDIVSTAVREAPLAALGFAFVIGIVFASPRR